MFENNYRPRNLFCYELSESSSFDCWPLLSSWFDEQVDRVENKLNEYVAHFLMSCPTWRDKVVDIRLCPVPTGLDTDSYVVALKRDDGKIGLIGSWRFSWVGKFQVKEISPGKILFHEETMAEAQRIVCDGFSYQFEEGEFSRPVKESKLSLLAQRYEDMCESIPYSEMHAIDETMGKALQNHARRYNKAYTFRISKMPDSKTYIYKSEKED